MCNVQRTCGCFQTTGDEGTRGCRIEGPNAAAWTAATHCPQTQIGWSKCRAAKGSEPSAGGPAAGGDGTALEDACATAGWLAATCSVEHGAWSGSGEWEWGVGVENGESSVE
jgi:hypothetical protein